MAFTIVIRVTGRFAILDYLVELASSIESQDDAIYLIYKNKLSISTAVEVLMAIIVVSELASYY